ncbi:MAG TPA: ACT domain-containing protein [Actinomycetota bacterium]|nr:ACT domain-containing protein [Actinomycetota bacterium]
MEPARTIDGESAANLGLYQTRLVADHEGAEQWTVRVALRDRRGALAAIASSFAGAGIAVCSAHIATGPGGVVIDVFRVDASEWTDWDRVRSRIDAGLVAGYGRTPSEAVDATLAIAPDGTGARSIIEVRAEDRVGLLAKVAAAISRAGVEIHQATITTIGTEAIDVFEVTGRTGAALTAADKRALRAAFAGKRVRRSVRRR